MSCGTLVPAHGLTISCTGLLPSLAAFSKALLLSSRLLYAGPQPQRACSLVWPLSRSLAATQEIDVSFSSSRYLDVSVPWVTLSCTILFMHGYLIITSGEFPHSEICGSTDVYSFPQLIAVSHVLLRLLVPRHSPYALIHLTK